MTNSRTTGIAATIVFHALLLVALFSWGFRIPYPPPAEDGILISFGNNDYGKGEIEPSRAVASVTPPQSSPKNDNHEPLLTQDYEDAPIVSKPQHRRKARTEMPAPQRTQPQAQQRIVNKDALFKGNSSGENNSSQGEGMYGASTQNQGTPDGSKITASARSYGGNSVNLAGRTLIGTLPAPKYDVQESGRVVVKIKVDRNGSVVEAKAQQSGSTLMNATLYAAAEQAAIRAKFNATSTDAPPYQNGTIVYVFRMGGG